TANRDAAIAMIIKHAKADPKDAEKTYDYLVTKLKAFSAEGLLTEAIFTRMKAGLIEMGDVQEPVPPLDRFFDASYIVDATGKRAEARGSRKEPEVADARRLASRTALITGGGGEIGTAIAKRFAGAGAAIAVGDLDPAKAAATADAIAGASGRAIAMMLD